MTTVIGVSFKRAGKMYYFDPNGMEMHIGDQVIVETARGMECGDVVTEIRQVEDEEVVQPLKAVIRLATDEDRKRIAINTKKEGEAFEIGQARILHHQLEMKLVDVEYTFDVSKIIFYFTANGRIDFRELVKDLASIFKTRIELRQIGVRDEAKMIGGLGSCGRPICCRTFLGDFQPVSIKMAKEQNLSLNPTKISGLCDRLMCCLKYEQDQYEATRKRMPRVGREIITPDGVGTINAINVLEETVRVRIAVGDAFELREYPIDDCQRPEQQNAPAAEKQEKAERREKPEKKQADKPEKQEEKAERREKQGDKPEKPAKGERRDKAERSEKPEKGDRPERASKPKRQERAEQGEKQGRNEGEKPARQRFEKPVKPVKTADNSAEPQMPRMAENRPVSEEDTLEIVEETAMEDLL